MKIICLLLLTWISLTPAASAESIQKFGVKPSNSPEVNKANLQKAIDSMTVIGGSLYVDPTDTPYRIAGGLILKKNVSLIGANAATPRGTAHPSKPQPVGSVIEITDRENVFITVESATQISGIQFWYSGQAIKDPSKIIEYPATIRLSYDHPCEGVTLSNLTFYGEYLAMDFAAPKGKACELITIEHCVGYPFGGTFIRIDYCYDIPRILHCHVNPAITRSFAGGYSPEIIDAVIAKKTFAYVIDHTDNAQLIDIFTFGTYGGIYLGAETYGQLTNFNFDCVAIGIHKLGSNSFNRNWQIAQGSIIANTGEAIENIHPILIEGKGHTAISNVEAFSGKNGALTTLGVSFDFLKVTGNDTCTISLMGCRMRNYTSDKALTVENENAVIQAVACIDKNEKIFTK
ncbi:MAG: hypothetical protein NTV01_17800 [Bacteroidia bacterium]|nr:hypothetical protein [Bacteroidia bacterium]